MRKLSFLPLFFVGLGVVFAIAVWFRVREVKDDQTTTQIARNTDVAVAADRVNAPIRSDGGAELVPADVTSTIEETGTTPSASTNGASAREQRYRELLNAPAPAAANGTPRANPQQAAVAEEPSLIDRVVKPIADALSGKRQQQPPPPPPQTANTRPRPERAPHPVNDQTGDDTSTNTRPEEERPQQDEDADTTPPQLLGAEFVPNQVADGDQTTLTIIATDNRAGVKHVSGVIVSPSGAQQGFACQREGESQRFSTRITVPREAAEGEWSVKYMTITDNASNPAHFNSAQGTMPAGARFRVTSSSSDSRGPVLKQIWLEQPSMSAGDKNFVNVQVDDDKSGVKLVSGVFISPTKQARIGFGCRLQNGNQWQCPITPSNCVDCGAWSLEQLQMHDNANNMTTLRGENEHVAAVRLQLFGDGCDNSPPQLVAVTVDPNTVQNGVASTIKVTIIATDDQCGVQSISGRATPPPSVASQYTNFTLRPAGDGQMFVGEISVSPNAANGVWSINWVQAIDKGHNQKTYTSADPALSRATFTVQ